MVRFAPLLLALACAPEGPPDDEPGDPSATPIDAYDPLALVDPFIATGGQGAEIANVNPGPRVPFGMVHLGPDTRRDFGAPPFYHCAGYWYEDDYVRGFSHTHAHGMGVPDYGAVRVLPRDGWDDSYTEEAARMAPFSHDQESASPGRYAVTLLDHDIDVDLTATQRGGHSRFRFPEGASPVIVLDLSQVMPGDDVGDDTWAEWEAGDPEIRGLHRVLGSYSGRFGGLMTHFVGRLDPAPIAGGGWTDPANPVDGLERVDGADAGIWLAFPEGTREVHLRVGISYVDVDNARANLEAELPDTDWEARAQEAEAAWRELMGRVRVRGGTPDEQVVFHTALFHSAFMPSRQDDVDGRYRGADQAIHTADGPHYSDLSLWDTFRTVHPWYLLAWPEVQNDVNRSIVRMIEDGGVLPKWPLAHGNTGGMVGSPAMQVLAESWLKGVRDWDADLAFATALATSREPQPSDGRGGLDGYLGAGFVAIEDGGGSVSDTLEYAWNDHALALWAEARGDAVAGSLFEQGRSWANHWSPEHGFTTGRYRDGSFVFREPHLWEPWFVEGNAWHYLWYAPFDPLAMIDVQHGGDRDAFLTRYRQYWADVAAEEDDVTTDEFYWHGNEPVMHVAFLGSLIDEPDSSADASRLVMATRYDTSTAGLDGNDDAGTLSAWFLWASIGVFPVAGTDVLAFSSPLWERVEIDRAPGESLVVRAPGASETVRYLKGWRLGETPVEGATIRHGAWVEAGELVLDLVDAPGAFAGE